MWLARLYWLNFPNFPSVKKRYIVYVTACKCYEKIVTASYGRANEKKKEENGTSGCVCAIMINFFTVLQHYSISQQPLANQSSKALNRIKMGIFLIHYFYTVIKWSGVQKKRRENGYIVDKWRKLRGKKLITGFH